MQDVHDILCRLAEHLVTEQEHQPTVKLTLLDEVELAINPEEPDDWLTVKKKLKLRKWRFSGASLNEAFSEAASMMLGRQVGRKRPTPAPGEDRWEWADPTIIILQRRAKLTYSDEEVTLTIRWASAAPPIFPEES